jgi:hypothetical protein
MDRAHLRRPRRTPPQRIANVESVDQIVIQIVHACFPPLKRRAIISRPQAGWSLCHSACPGVPWEPLGEESAFQFWQLPNSRSFPFIRG